MIGPKPWRIAVVGTGPAAMYAVDHLLENRDCEIEADLFDRLPHPWGLIRNGVAPDHPEKKAIVDRTFAYHFADSRLRFFGGIDIGRDISHVELAGWYDAVIYAVGADNDRRLGVSGENLPGSWSARQFVAWYNGHLGNCGLDFDLTDRRAVIVGNGNVALDVARMLTLPDSALRRTDIADHALATLRSSRIEEVIVLGRRGPEHAAFHNPELEELEHLDGVDVMVEPEGFDVARVDARNPYDFQQQRKMQTLDRIRGRSAKSGGKRIVLKFHAVPVAIAGRDKVEGISIGAGEDRSFIDCGLVIRAVGYRVTAFPGLPFDDDRHVISNSHGRVGHNGSALPGVYVAGWAKRGCRGVIGSNKKCARETVDALFADIAAGHLQRHGLDRERAGAEILARCPQFVSRSGWSRIDRSERDAGRLDARPRVKVTDLERMLALATGGGT